MKYIQWGRHDFLKTQKLLEWGKHQMAETGVGPAPLFYSTLPFSISSFSQVFHWESKAQ